MLQIIAWALAIIIFGLGYLGYIIGRASPDESKKNVGTTFFILMILLAVVIAILAYYQGQAVTQLFK